MAIRIRKVDGVTIALCAAETDEVEGDIYLDDTIHYALAAKFAQDWNLDWIYSREWDLMATQKVRDAKEELLKFLKE